MPLQLKIKGEYTVFTLWLLHNLLVVSPVNVGLHYVTLHQSFLQKHSYFDENFTRKGVLEIDEMKLLLVYSQTII